MKKSKPTMLVLAWLIVSTSSSTCEILHSFTIFCSGWDKMRRCQERNTEASRTSPVNEMNTITTLHLMWLNFKAYASMHIHTERWAHVLFSGIGELVFSATVVGLLDSRISPQAFNSYDIVLIKPIDLLNIHFLHKHGIGLERHVWKQRD